MTLSSGLPRIQTHRAGRCPGCTGSEVGSRCFVWFDLRRTPRSPSPFHDIAPCAGGHLVAGDGDPVATILAVRPGFLVFEFDTADRHGIETLALVRRWFPDLPLMMLTEAPSETLAVWALRVRVWDYLVKPLPAGEIAPRIEALCHVAHHARRDRLRQPSVPELRAPAQPAPPHRALRTAPAVAYVEAHYPDRVDVATLAALCRLSSSSFSRLFRREHGTTFTDYLLHYRVEQARRRIAGGHTSLREVAQETGFCDQSRLSKAFKRVLGVCPGHYQPPA